MLPEPLPAVLRWLQTAGSPMSTKDLWDEMSLKDTREPPAGLPQKLGHLSNAMMALLMEEKVIEKGGKWHPVYEPVKPKVERSLF